MIDPGTVHDRLVDADLRNFTRRISPHRLPEAPKKTSSNFSGCRFCARQGGWTLARGVGDCLQKLGTHGCSQASASARGIHAPRRLFYRGTDACSSTLTPQGAVGHGPGPRTSSWYGCLWAAILFGYFELSKEYLTHCLSCVVNSPSQAHTSHRMYAGAGPAKVVR